MIAMTLANSKMHVRTSTMLIGYLKYSVLAQVEKCTYLEKYVKDIEYVTS